MDSPDSVTRVDLQEGRVVWVDRTVLSAAEEGDEEALGKLPGWEKPEVEVARAMAAASPGRFVEAPSKFDFHEYRQMERFIGTVGDPGAAEQLWRAIKGKGAFRYFKDTAHRLGLLEAWFQFRAEAMKEFVINWAEARNVSWEDDLKRKSSP